VDGYSRFKRITAREKDQAVRVIREKSKPLEEITIR